MTHRYQAINFQDKLARFSDHWAPKVVAQMTALGYVRTVTDPDDARARPVVVTAAGRKAMALAATVQGQLESELARAAGRADVDATRRVMEVALRRWAAGAATSRQLLS